MRKNNYSLCGLVVLGLLLLPARSSLAWIDTGHKIVALVAWDDLTPATKQKVSALLKQHARYEKDLLAGVSPDVKGDELDRYAFAGAAVWPDVVKSPANPMHTLYSHPGWHYIDLPFVVDGQAPPAPEKDTSPGPHNVLEALAKNSADLNDPKVSGPEKAVAICWLIHLVGDIHQPLHTTSMFSPQYPKGDQGGNSQVVLRDPPYTDSRANLHLIWDELPGQYRSDEFDSYIAEGLRQDPQWSREHFKDQLQVKDFAAWAQEGHVLAVNDAYLNGKLETAPAHEKAGSARSTIPGLPPGYLEKAEHVAMQQLSLAGYRLADLLNSHFSQNP